MLSLSALGWKVRHEVDQLLTRLYASGGIVPSRNDVVRGLMVEVDGYAPLSSFGGRERNTGELLDPGPCPACDEPRHEGPCLTLIYGKD